MLLVCFVLADGGDVCSGSITLSSRGVGWAWADKKIYRSPDTCNPSRFCLANASHTPAWAHLCYQRIKQQEVGSPCFIYDSSKALKIGRFTKVIKIADLWLLGVCAGRGWYMSMCVVFFRWGVNHGRVFLYPPSLKVGESGGDGWWTFSEKECMWAENDQEDTFHHLPFVRGSRHATRPAVYADIYSFISTCCTESSPSAFLLRGLASGCVCLFNWPWGA